VKHSYAIKGFQWVEAAALKPHPAAELPIDADDRANIGRSIGEYQAVFQPLLITAQNEIVDGINRWREAQAQGLTSLPCLVIEAADPAQVVRECLATGRKRTTGQRIMTYLDAHKREVLAAWEINAGKGEIFRKRSNRSNDRLAGEKGCEWTAEAIAHRLQCSDKDVRAGIELLDAIETKRRYELLGVRGKPGSATAEYLASLDKQRLSVLSGSSGIRRWRNAVGGREATAGKERHDPDYGTLVRKAAVTLLNGFRAWGGIKWAGSSREVSLGALREAFAAAPPDVRALMAEAMLTEWPEAEVKALAVALRKPGRTAR
jgi:hypothetical protein